MKETFVVDCSTKKFQTHIPKGEMEFWTHLTRHKACTNVLGSRAIILDKYKISTTEGIQPGQREGRKDIPGEAMMGIAWRRSDGEMNISWVRRKRNNIIKGGIIRCKFSMVGETRAWTKVSEAWTLGLRERISRWCWRCGENRPWRTQKSWEWEAIQWFQVGRGTWSDFAFLNDPVEWKRLYKYKEYDFQKWLITKSDSS